MTFSIVAHCRRSGQYGVGIATYSPNVGARCPLVVPGRGAAAVQAVANPELIQQARDLIARGLSAEKVIAELGSGDPHPEHRQLAVVDVYGHAAARTGQRNPAWFGHRVGEGFVEGNGFDAIDGSVDDADGAPLAFGGGFLEQFDPGGTAFAGLGGNDADDKTGAIGVAELALEDRPGAESPGGDIGFGHRFEVR